MEYPTPRSSWSGALDPTRTAAQVVSGIGFLVAGIIMREGGGVTGLTTAATVWVTAAAGLTRGTRASEIRCHPIDRFCGIIQDVFTTESVSGSKREESPWES